MNFISTLSSDSLGEPQGQTLPLQHVSPVQELEEGTEAELFDDPTELTEDAETENVISARPEPLSVVRRLPLYNPARPRETVLSRFYVPVRGYCR